MDDRLRLAVSKRACIPPPRWVACVMQVGTVLLHIYVWRQLPFSVPQVDCRYPDCDCWYLL